MVVVVIPSYGRVCVGKDRGKKGDTVTCSRVELTFTYTRGINPRPPQESLRSSPPQIIATHHSFPHHPGHTPSPQRKNGERDVVDVDDRHGHGRKLVRDGLHI